MLIHIEVQGEPEDDFPLRMFRYNVRVFVRYDRTVVIPAVLTDDRRDGHETFGQGAISGAGVSVREVWAD